jgi:hypothetical protein
VVPNPSKVVLLDTKQRSKRSTRRCAERLRPGVPETPTTPSWGVLESLRWYLDDLIFQATANNSGGGKMDEHASGEAIVESLAVTELSLFLCRSR